MNIKDFLIKFTNNNPIHIIAMKCVNCFTSINFSYGEPLNIQPITLPLQNDIIIIASL